MKLTTLFSAFLLVISNALGQGIQDQFQHVLDTIIQNHPEAHGVLVHVEAPNRNISWSGASGYSSKDEKTPIDPEQPAWTASCIKPYVAASILKLEEQNLLKIDDFIEFHLPDSIIIIFEEAGFDFSKISIKHLLSHSSGIEDYANEEYLELVDSNPKYRWTRFEQLKRAVTVGKKLGEPGEVFSYADANFLLLTIIIEQIKEKPFYSAMRELLMFDELGYHSTHFPTLEKRPKNLKPRVHQYYSKYNWDSYNHDISWDLYGGGGLESTTKDLAQFGYDLFNYKIIKDTVVFKQIFTEVVPSIYDKYKYFLGLSSDSHQGYICYGHGGFWGTLFMYYPELDACISVYVLDRSSAPLRATILEGLIQVLNKE